MKIKDWFKFIWKDPVWSKVIATGIISLLAFLAAKYTKVWPLIISKTAIPNWLFFILIIIFLFFTYSKLRKGKRTTSEEYSICRDPIVKQILDAGITAFYQSRSDYGRYRKNAATIDAYIATADKSILIVSINLMTGITFDGLCKFFENKLEEREQSITVTISLLNPWKEELIMALAPVLEFEPKRLSESIQNTLAELHKLKGKMSRQAKDRFNIKVHNSIPFGSAIILDEGTEKGRIQIETKAYKAPLRKSFAFEVSNKENNEFYRTLVEGYNLLVKDGVTYESLITNSGENHEHP
jgi:hypothetical protein